MKKIEEMTQEELGKAIEAGEVNIRKLTPRECYRLMGFDDKDFDAASKVNSNSQLYKQAGNSIVVACNEALFGQLFDGKENHYKRWGKVKYNEEEYA